MTNKPPISEELSKEDFAVAHAQICFMQYGPHKRRSPSYRRKCGRELYDYLKQNNLPLDIYYNQKKFNKLPPTT